MCFPAGADFALRSTADGVLALETRTGSRQLLHPLPHSSGRPAGHGILGSVFQSDPDVDLSRKWTLTEIYFPHILFSILYL